MNRLAKSTSPYLRQHADNPVDWWPWIPEAFADAKRRNVPIHLSIGYAACHWCHVMARESFSNAEIAAQLNRDFVSIKVDREERPEVDQVYMRALHALGEQGGWPLTMFLTPKAEPFWGGTYFPPEPRYGRVGFPQILRAVSDAWRKQDPAILQNAAALTSHLKRTGDSTHVRAAGVSDPKLLDEAAKKILAIWDMERGSFKGAPKFPNPVVMEMLWRAWLRTGDTAYRSAVLNTLTFLSQGGIYDHVGGGFARYSVDARWLVPHFEKMLYDNGLLLSALAYAHRETRGALFRDRIDETVAWLTREMQLPGGGLASSLDADTDHEEGLTYVWTRDELAAALKDDLPSFASVYDASSGGNWEGKIILNRLAHPSKGWLGAEKEAGLRAARASLLQIRDRRPQPGRDDKVLADWNGLAIAGLAQAARATGNADAKRVAVEAYRFVSDSMQRSGRLGHSILEGNLIWPGVATDYANMIRASLELFSLTGASTYLPLAEAWFAAVKHHHFDADAGAYSLVADDGLALIAPAASVQDEATPAATGIMASNAATLFTLTGNTDYREHAERIVAALQERAIQDPVGSASLQSGFDTLVRGRLAVVSGNPTEVEHLVAACLTDADPALMILSIGTEHLPPGHPAAGKRPSKTDAALFLCDAFSCLPEISNPAEAVSVLQRTRSAGLKTG